MRRQVDHHLARARAVGRRGSAHCRAEVWPSLVAYASLTGRQIDLEFAQGMLADFVRANARRITIDEIQKLTAQHFQIRSEERSVGKGCGRTGRYWGAPEY